MSKELDYTKNPRRMTVKWSVFYGLIALACVAAFLVATGHFRTYSVPHGVLDLKVPYAKYLVGEPVTFTMTNNYNSPIYLVDNCPGEPLAVYRREGTTWVRIHDSVPQNDCSDKERQVVIAPGETRNGSFAPWTHLFQTPGSYRIAAMVEYFNVAPYQDFEVIDKPAIATQTPSTTPVNTPAQTPQAPPTAPTPQPSPPATTPTPDTPTQKTVSIADGAIAVSYTGSYITVQSITPAAGCTYEGGRSGIQVEVTFKCGGGEMQLQLQVVNGQLQQKVEAG